MEQTSFILAHNNKPEKLEEFKLIMRDTNASLNTQAESDPTRFKKEGGKGMEKEVINTIKEVARDSSFNSDDIKLISGQRFPDIVARYFSSTKGEKGDSFYGVEVKTTNEDKWTSIGSSIVESTRVPNVERIFLMFGKLGNKVEFMCRPYEECMSGIAVTHSPRYTIDMRLKKDESIFEKMGTTYDDFRQSDNQFKMLRKHYLDEARSKGVNEMPWWMGDSYDVGVTLFSDIKRAQKEKIKIYLMILFDGVYSSDYKEAVLWMCARLNILNHNARDLFSAGGQCYEFVDGKKVLYPQIVKRVVEYAPQIKSLLDSPDEFILTELEQYWGVANYDNLYEQWLKRVERVFKATPKLKNVPIRRLISSQVELVVEPKKG